MADPGNEPAIPPTTTEENQEENLEVALDNQAVGPAAICWGWWRPGRPPYRVTDRWLSPKQPLDRAGVLRSGGPSTLVLVSSGGAFLTAKQAYTDNVVIVATPAAGVTASGQ
jgi:hypothetical protein